MVQVDWSAVGIVVTVVSAVSGLTWWLSGQFNIVRTLVFENASKTEKTILDKIEYHERHDDSRFSEIRDDLSEIRIRNAAKDALMTSIITKLDKANGK